MLSGLPKSNLFFVEPRILEEQNLVLGGFLFFYFFVFKIVLLGSKELGTDVLELHFVMLANYDQNILDLLKVYAIYVKLESSCCKIYCVNLPGSID